MIAAASGTFPGPGTVPLLRVDLAAIRSNYREMRRRYSGTTLSAVLKSDAYGLGLENTAAALVEEGCKHFWVNDIGEATRLRRVAPDAGIHCLMGLAGSDIRDFEAVAAIPALASLAEIAHCVDHVARTGRRIAVAIQFDTGLGRLGLSADDVERLAAQTDLLQGLDIRLYLSQLAAYNVPDDPCNVEQHREMRRLSGLLPPAPTSLGASSAVFMEKGWHFDMARVGSALFGVQTSSHFQEGLKPCYTLSGPILAVADHPSGRQLGYRGATKLTRRSRIATVAIGYANGLPQSLADFGHARVLGKPAPIVGGIAMNMTMIDLTDLPADSHLVGEEAVFLGPGQEIEPIAERLRFAPNVLLTQIGSGTRKHYVGE